MTEPQTDNRNPDCGEKSPVHEIHAHESQRKYKLVHLDFTEVERTTTELFAGSKLLKNLDLWLENFKATLGVVQEWCRSSQGKVRMVLVDIRSNKVLFYFVPQSDRYDLKLGAEMTDLEVKIGGSAGIGYVETLQVPERSLHRFAGEKSLVVWELESKLS